MLLCNQPKQEARNTTGQTSQWSHNLLQHIYPENNFCPLFLHPHFFSLSSEIFLKAFDTKVALMSSWYISPQTELSVVPVESITASCIRFSFSQKLTLEQSTCRVFSHSYYDNKVHNEGRALGKLLWTNGKRQNRSFVADVFGMNLYLLWQAKKLFFFSLNNLNKLYVSKSGMSIMLCLRSHKDVL